MTFKRALWALFSFYLIVYNKYWIAFGVLLSCIILSSNLLQMYTYPLLHSQLRLAIMSILISVIEADFLYLKEKTEASAGNLSVQIDKLSAANFVENLKTYLK